MKKPKVLIVGAGIEGLMLGNLLHKGNIPSLIFERAKEVKPLGSAVSIGSSLSSLFEQIGILDEFKEIGKHMNRMQAFDDNLKPIYGMTFTEREKVFSLLLQERERPGCHDSSHDNSTHHGDILVGADGVYSAVRQQLYKDLKEKKKLPASDNVPFPFSCVCLVGQTEVLDPEEFPDLTLPESKINAVLGSHQAYTVAQMIASKTHDAFRNSEWGPEAAEAMYKSVRDFKIPGGKDGQDVRLGSLIDRTPKDLISKVMLEEKVFDAWFSGRTVLLGDACHTLNPAGGAGALFAIHDAVALANWICALEPKKMEGIEKVFKEYYDERYPNAKEVFKNSQMFRNVVGKNMTARLLRAMTKRVPAWAWRRLMIKMVKDRPTVSFLPLVEDKGTVPPFHQASLHKTLPIIQQRQGSIAAV
ncbi:hypothetical protein BG003_005738 [Podila horticola]|nr:hypothetical protein BG003_005738 [Podila horticola]